MTDASTHPGVDAMPGWLAEMRRRGELSADWARLVTGFPRRAVLPDLVWPFTADGYLTVDRREDTGAWASWADADVPVVTQWDDGRHAGREPGVMATASASQPSLVARMLSDLDVRPGHRVLDVGAGTGWTTGLLARRVGDRGYVAGVEVDPDVAAAAGARLRAAGVAATVVTGDGAGGLPEGAPYDRVHAGFAVREVPAAWIAQTRPGGLITVPWGTRWTNTAAVVVLRVGDDGVASGRFTRPVEFMLDRGQRGDWPAHEEYLPGEDWPDDTRESVTTLTRDDVADAAFFVGLRVTGAVHTSAVTGDGATMTVVYGLTDRSWAAVFHRDDGDGESDIFQGGPRDLWHEVETACRWWQGLGRPDVSRFGLVVSPSGRRVFLGDP